MVARDKCESSFAMDDDGEISPSRNNDVNVTFVLSPTYVVKCNEGHGESRAKELTRLIETVFLLT